MTDREHFELVLQEVEGLMAALYRVGLHDSTVMIGAQVVALEQRARHQAPFELNLPTGLTLARPFSYEPDLVFDTDEPNRIEAVPEAMRQAGFERSHRQGRPASWAKKVGEVTIEVDLFGTAADAEHSVSLTPLRGAPRFPQKELNLSSSWTIRVPDAYAFLSLKLEAKLRIRPTGTKDSVDLFAYAHVVGADEIQRSLDRQGKEGNRVRSELRGLFGAETDQGVADVVAGLGSTLGAFERELLIRAVLDTFAPLLDPSTPQK